MNDDKGPMPTPPDDEPRPEAEAAPTADEARRLRLTRRLLRSAVRRYRRSLAFSRRVDAHFPDVYHAPGSSEDSPSLYHRREGDAANWRWPDGDRGLWIRLMFEADSEFYSAEVELATRIANLFHALAPELESSGPVPPGREFPELAVRLDGRTYMLLYDPAQYEPGNVIIAVTPIERTIGLDD
jgi:hypothetical protein